MPNFNVEDAEKKLAFIKKLNDCLKQDGLEPISEASLGKFVVDFDREKNHEKAKELINLRNQRQDTYSKTRKEMGMDKPPLQNFVRVMGNFMDLSGTPEAETHNKEMITKTSTLDGCAEEVDKLVKDALKVDYSKMYSTTASISSIMNSYAENSTVYEKAFTINSYGNNKFGEYVYDPRLKDVMDKKSLIEGLNNGFCATTIAASELYTYLPDEAFDPKKIECFIAHIDEIKKEFPEITQKCNFDVIGLSNCITDAGTFVNNRNISKYIQEGKMPDPLTFMKYCHYERDGKKISNKEMLEMINEGKNIDEYKLVYCSEEEKQRIDEAINSDKPLFGKFEDMVKDENVKTGPELKVYAGITLASICNDFYRSKGLREIKDIEIEEAVYDKEKQRLHEEALRIKEFEKKQETISRQIQEKLGVKTITGQQSRLISTYIDVSGTEEANRKNEELIWKASTEKGMLELANQALKEIISLDPKEVYAKDTTMQSYIEHSKENNARNRRCYIINSLYSSYELDYRVKDILSKNLTFLENNESERAVNLAASEWYGLLPDSVLENPELSQYLLDNMPKIQDNLGKYSDTFKFEHMVEDLSNMKVLGDLRQGEFTKDMVKEGKTNIFSGVYNVEGKENSSFGDLHDANKQGKNIVYTELSESRKKEIQNVIKGDIIVSKDKQKQNIDNLFDSLEGKEGSIFDNGKDINKTHSIFSRDSKQFKEMEASLKEVTIIAKNYKEQNVKDLNAKCQLGRDLRQALNDLREKTITYRDKKQNEKDTQKKFSTRSQNRLDLANNLLKIVDNTLEFDKVKVTENPARKPLPMDKVQKLTNDTKEKAVVMEKQKVVNEPVKEVNLEQGLKQ